MIAGPGAVTATSPTLKIQGSKQREGVAKAAPSLRRKKPTTYEERKMIRKTKSIPQALERLAPFIETVGYDIDYLGGGKWDVIHWPSEKYFGGPHERKSDRLFADLVYTIELHHPDAEAVKHAVRWSGNIHKLERAGKIKHNFLQALRWFNIDEKYDSHQRRLPAKQVHGHTHVESANGIIPLCQESCQQECFYDCKLNPRPGRG